MKNLTKLRSRATEEYQAFRAELLKEAAKGLGVSALGRIYGVDRRLIDYHLRKGRLEAEFQSPSQD